METVQQSKLEFWRAHVASAEKFPAGVGAYCAEQGLKLPTYYGWRKRVSSKGPTLKAGKIKRAKKVESPFLPVKIASGQAEPMFHSTSKLPDARWVAEVILHLAGGF